MKRRTAIRNIGLVTGGLFLMPSCNFSEERIPIVLNKLKITTDEEILLESIVDTILPETNTPGGLALKVQNFIWIQMDDCASPEQQTSYLSGLRSFNALVRERYYDDFISLNAEKRLQILSELMGGKDTPSSILEFLNTTKHTAVWGYKNTQYYLTNLMPFQLIPGAFSYKTKTINPNEKINTNA